MKPRLIDAVEYETAWSLPALIGGNRGGRSFQSEVLHVCAVCFTQTEATFKATTESHHIFNRSRNPTKAALCVKCWSRLLKEDDDG